MCTHSIGTQLSDQGEFNLSESEELHVVLNTIDDVTLPSTEISSSTSVVIKRESTSRDLNHDISADVRTPQGIAVSKESDADVTSRAPPLFSVRPCRPPD